MVVITCELYWKNWVLFITMIKTLHTDPSAAVQTGNILSETFPLHCCRYILHCHLNHWLRQFSNILKFH